MHRGRGVVAPRPRRGPEWLRVVKKQWWGCEQRHAPAPRRMAPRCTLAHFGGQPTGRPQLGCAHERAEPHGCPRRAARRDTRRAAAPHRPPHLHRLLGQVHRPWTQGSASAPSARQSSPPTRRSAATWPSASAGPGPKRSGRRPGPRTTSTMRAAACSATSAASAC